MKYQVTITETLSRKISVDAPSAEIAKEHVRGLYREEDIVLGSSDFCFFDVDVSGEEAKPFFLSNGGDFTLYHGDCMELLPILNEKADMVFADPPYFLSNGGISVQNGKIVSVNKGDWDKGMQQADIDAFNKKWIGQCREILKDNGTIWISGTYHNIFSVANCLTQLGYKILNVITWAKTNPPPNISCRYFTYSTEFIIWARKMAKVPHYYNYELMKAINDGKQMTDVWRLPAIAPWEKSCGKHPTQKPLGLLSRIIMASTEPGTWVLDPFAGSSTTGIAANLLGRRFLGIEKEEEFVKISKARREEIEDIKNFTTYKRKIPDIVKAEDRQKDIFSFHEDTPIIALPFLEDNDSETDSTNSTYVGKNVSTTEEHTIASARIGVLMYAVGNNSRIKTEHAGKIALGFKCGMFSEQEIKDTSYVIFHYWNNEKAHAYKLEDAPRIVAREDVPNGYLKRQEKGADLFLLLEYNTDTIADLGTLDITKVQRKGRERYLPFVTEMCNVMAT